MIPIETGRVICGKLDVIDEALPGIDEGVNDAVGVTDRPRVGAVEMDVDQRSCGTERSATSPAGMSLLSVMVSVSPGWTCSVGDSKPWSVTKQNSERLASSS